MPESYVMLKTIRDDQHNMYGQTWHQLKILRVPKNKDELNHVNNWLNYLFNSDEAVCVKLQDFDELEEEFLVKAAIESCYPDYIVNLANVLNNGEYKLVVDNIVDTSLQFT